MKEELKVTDYYWSSLVSLIASFLILIKSESTTNDLDFKFNGRETEGIEKEIKKSPLKGFSHKRQISSCLQMM